MSCLRKDPRLEAAHLGQWMYSVSPCRSISSLSGTAGGPGGQPQLRGREGVSRHQKALSEGCSGGHDDNAPVVFIHLNPFWILVMLHQDVTHGMEGPWVQCIYVLCQCRPQCHLVHVIVGVGGLRAQETADLQGREGVYQPLQVPVRSAQV